MVPIRRFQLHLVTLLVLSFTASGLLWVNVRGSPGYPYLADYETSGPLYEPKIKYHPSVGWPKAFLKPDMQVIYITSATNVSYPIFLPSGPGTAGEIRTWNLIVDLAVALGILLSVGVLCEVILRRGKNAGETPAPQLASIT